jgi:non-ribosomal peptide synthetase component F
MSMANLLTEAAGLYPDKDALLDGKQSYTFGELDRLSANFASFLLSHGAQRGDRIAFCSPKSARLIVAIFGCLKAGAIYVPMDSKLPKDRLLFILNNVSPRFIIASQALYGAVAADLAATSALIDEDCLPECYEYPGAGTSLPPIADEDIAYCIYTSGSTGRPKGVLIEHGSVDVFFRALAEIMPITASSRCMNTSELYFDVHVMDLFFPLHRGATVHLSCAPMVANKLLLTLERERITYFTAVGPLMTLMTEGSLFDTCELAADGLFSHLQSVFRQALPYYMVPSLYFLFDRFPTLPSGKTDKKQILNRVNQCMQSADVRLTRFVCPEEALCDLKTVLSD